MTLDAGTLKKLTSKELKELKPNVDKKLHYLIDKVIESKRTGFGVYTDPSKAGKKGSKVKWDNEKRNSTK